MDDDLYLNLSGRRSTHGYGLAQDLAQPESPAGPPRKPLWARRGIAWHQEPLHGAIAPWGSFRWRWTLRVKVPGSPHLLRVAQGFTWRMATASRHLDEAANVHRDKMNPS